MEGKPWRNAGAKVSDWFNYGFNEETWRAYCRKQTRLREENRMQNKIEVVSSAGGRRSRSRERERSRSRSRSRGRRERERRASPPPGLRKRSRSRSPVRGRSRERDAEKRRR